MDGSQVDEARQGYALTRDESSPVLSQTLVRLAERLATTLSTWECCIYEYLPDEDLLRCVVVWSRELTADDREWVGSLHDIHRHEGVRPVFDERRTVVLQREDEPDDVRDRERMDYWHEKTALYSPLVVDDEVLGLLELTERRAERHFDEGEIALVEALGDVAAIAIANARASLETVTRNRHLTALLESSKALGSTMLLDEVLQLLAEHAARAVNAASAYIYEYDPLEETLTWHCQYQRDHERSFDDPVGTVYKVAEFPVDDAVIHRGEVTEARVDDPELDEKSRDDLIGWGEMTMLSVPMVCGEAMVGVIELAETDYVRHFTDEEVALVRAIGEQAAAAIRNTQLYRRESWRNDRLVHVLEISHFVGTTLEPDAVVDHVESRMARLFPSRAAKATVYLVPEGAASQGGEAGDTAAPHGEGVDPLQQVDESGCRLTVPLLAKGRAAGRLEILSPVPRAFDQDEVELVQILANQVAASVENARLYSRLEEQAITDGLTGLYNHRFFYDRLQAEVTRARRYGLQMSLLMLDLDDFKRFNDQFGHQAGDLVLSETGKIMRKQLRRDIDIPCRYGGEEFAIILPHTPIAGAETVGKRLTEQVEALMGDEGPVDAAWLTGERVRRTIETSPFPGRDPEETTHITVSIGVATYPDQAQDVQSLVGNADKALYVAKNKGKNRVELFA